MQPREFSNGQASMYTCRTELQKPERLAPALGLGSQLSLKSDDDFIVAVRGTFSEA
jgi:hypothetical protein